MPAETTKVGNEIEEIGRQSETDETEIKNKRSLCGHCANVFRNITVEPCTLLYIMAIMITSTASQNLSLEKACRVNLKYPDEICDSLKSQDVESQNEYEKETQKLLARALAWNTYLSATIPCVLVLFAGSFSDRTGYRKIFIAVSIIGQIICGLNAIINIYFFHQLPLEVLIFSGALLEGLSGGWCLCFLAIFVFICAITKEEDRTFRMGLVNLNITVAYPIGMGSAGPILKALGYYGCYGISMTLHVINLMYIAFILKDPVRNKAQKENVKDTIRVVYKKTPDNRRVRMFILLGLVCVLFGPIYGENAVMYMLTRYRFNWDEIRYSLFQAYNFVVPTFGTVFAILVFSKYLQWHDALLGIISTISKILGSFVYAFAPNGRIFFIAPLVDILHGTGMLAVSAIFSKMVATNELGSVYSVVSLMENLMPLVYVPLYTMVYTATMDVLPGAVFLVGSTLTVPALFVFSYLFYEHRQQVRKSKI